MRDGRQTIMKASDPLTVGGRQLHRSVDRTERRWFRHRTARFVLGASLALWVAIAVVSYWFV